MGFQLSDRQTNLLHRIAVADSNTVVLLNGFEVNRDTQRRAHFVLSAVTAPDGPGLVEEAFPTFGELFIDLARFTDEFFFVFDQG